ncbi:MAG: hypothetical protein ABI347_01825 [Nitrososphaera sp.]
MSDPSSSIILATKYGEQAIRLIRSATRSLSYVIYVTGALVVIALMDIFGVLYRLQLYSELQHDYIISVIALVLLGVLVPLIWRVLKARAMLDSWQQVFARGSLQMAISISMASRNKGEALRAVAEAVAELEPLRQHLDLAGTLCFTDVSVSKVSFDVLVDESLVESDELKSLLRQYGAIAIALYDVADASNVLEFHKKLESYSESTGREIGIAVIVAGEITREAIEQAGDILLIEKS